MKLKLLIIGGLMLLGLGGVLVFAGGEQKSATVQNNKPEVSIQTISNDMSNGGQLVDVRTVEEYGSGHIDGAVNLPLQEIQSGTMPNTAKDKPVYVYCRSGSRSGQATAALKDAGYQNVVDLGAITKVQSLGGVIKS